MNLSLHRIFLGIWKAADFSQSLTMKSPVIEIPPIRNGSAAWRILSLSWFVKSCHCILFSFSSCQMTTICYNYGHITLLSLVLSLSYSQFEHDTVLIPKETAWFGYYPDGAFEPILPAQKVWCEIWLREMFNLYYFLLPLQKQDTPSQYYVLHIYMIPKKDQARA